MGLGAYDLRIHLDEDRSQLVFETDIEAHKNTTRTFTIDEADQEINLNAEGKGVFSLTRHYPRVFCIARIKDETGYSNPDRLGFEF